MANSGMGKRRAAAKAEGGAAYQQRRQEILKIAAGVFKEKGLKGASLGEIAEAVGTDRASLYYYIGSRQELFDDVVRKAVEANVAMAEAIRGWDASAPVKLRELAVGLMKSYAENYPFAYVYIQEDLNQLGDRNEAAHALNRRYDAAVIGIIQEGLDAGTLRSTASARTIAFGFIGMLNWTHRWYDPSKEPDAEKIGNAFADMVLEGLQVKRNHRRAKP
ncbi:TetR family transcriptional regulator [Actinomadura sp. LD22]|uniref:TetR family transcriptional regulator n=1 Tax=Actinomadura physcomitrii TaxID=2650748 RepID=A0A6I4M9M7_9ACTN|nr:TetR/AcrR family transcriptional regulator [Actinomadura physcomitrii]MWA02918.1 TetR family transcriptional regulator [Actinomadura physcomitrii]